MKRNHHPAFTLRIGLLMAALGVSIAGAVWTYLQEDAKDGTQAVAPSVDKHTRDKADSTPHRTLDERTQSSTAAPGYFEIRNREAAHVQSDPFAPLAVVEPVQPKLTAVAEPVIQPKAPPLPFQYLGKMVELPKAGIQGGITKKGQNASQLGETVVYLGRGDETFEVKPGEQIDKNYQFIGLQGDNLIIQYLPLSERQMLPIGELN